PGILPGLTTRRTTASAPQTLQKLPTTTARRSRSDLHIYRGLGANTLEISGSLPLADAGFVGGVAIPDPALAFVSMLRDALIKRGVKIDGRLRTVNARSGVSVLPRTPPGFASGSIAQFPV